MYQLNVLEERRGVWAKTILKSKIFKKEVANLSQAINGEGISKKISFKLKLFAEIERLFCSTINGSWHVFVVL